MSAPTMMRAKAIKGSPRIKPRRSVVFTVLTALFVIYALIPLVWLLISATKTQADYVSTFGFAFGDSFALFDNIKQTFAYRDGIFGRWFLNTIMYVVVGAGGATLLAVLGGYGLAKYKFPGRRGVIAVVMGAIAVPSTALTVPLFLMFSKVGLVNTPWAVIIPCLITPFGFYLMWVFASEAVPDELLEAARVDGSSEFNTFFRISLPLLGPGIVTVALFAIVATWNNYFLPLIMLTSEKWKPLTTGLNDIKLQTYSAAGGANPLQNVIITGSLLTIIPLIIAFLFLQRYWQSGLAAGSVKE
ncbi:carbohydrate ABC transporter permease [Tessaracoccus sp. HDW20]|uniref:carbohydrate ABC transporter permease n=1 Tax=Tessaracoccus coleopterorum TaxID=2714950 RepID=UPI001E4A68BB|nr:carbohydrate ABC transporter permease [Tessaracoccus coleopterorum]NHB84722.1 carbohydrate ABC transporter permease [Tessaracoccus coleopterorum]